MTIHLEDEIIQHTRDNPQRLPTLDMILDRFALALPLAFKSFLQVLPEIQETARTDIRCDAAIEGLPSPALISVVRADPWAGRVACVIEPDLLFTVLELMLGGAKGKASEWKPRSFTAIERSIGTRISEVVVSTLETCFGPIIETAFEREMIETMPRALVLAQPGSPSILARYVVDLDGRRGHVTLIVPYGAYGEVRGVLAAPYQGGIANGSHGGWDSEMGQCIADASLTLSVELTRIHVPLREVLGWRKGQVLDLGVTQNAPVTGMVNGTPALRGSFGHRNNGSLAMRVSEKLISSQEALGDVDHDD